MLLTVYVLVLVFVKTGMSVKVVAPPCDRLMFDSKVDGCLSDFNKSVETTGYQDRCPWPDVKRIYNDLKHCVDDWAKASLCRGCGFLVDEVFLKVHDTYFSHCGRVRDPPLTTLMMFIAPCIVATLLLPFLCVGLTTYNTDMPVAY